MLPTAVDLAILCYVPYAYDAESRIKTFNGSAAAYTYDADGQRVYKQAGGVTTEYIYNNGQPLAERNAAGEWSDFIYVGGRRLVKADTFEDRILISGTNCSNCGSQWTAFAFPSAGGLAGYVVQSGDKLCLRQYQWNGARGGMDVAFTDGSSTEWAASDQSGQVLNDESSPGGWFYRRADLTAYAGKTISNIYLIADENTPAGSWSIYYNDIALTSTDGTVHPIYTRQKTVSLTVSGTSGVTGVSYAVNHDPGVLGSSNFSDNMTNYHHGDHLGSQRLMTSVDGYPVWSATYLPFGQEWNPQPTIHHYKFTGKERDSESGLDNFGARYNSSTMGRFMSPDSPKFSEKTDPQTWNLYSYVSNNPLARVDLTGNNWFNMNGSWQWYDGANVTNDGKSCKQGTKGCNHSDYTHLLVIQKLDEKTDKGATKVKITLYGQNKVIAQGIGFTGGTGISPVPNGNYEINLNNRGGTETNGVVAVAGGRALAPFHDGIQEIGGNAIYNSSELPYDFRPDWGTLRANLSRGPDDGTAYYLHGKGLYFTEGHSYTAGCVCDPYQSVLKVIFSLDPSGVGEGDKNGRIAVSVSKSN